MAGREGTPTIYFDSTSPSPEQAQQASGVLPRPTECRAKQIKRLPVLRMALCESVFHQKFIRPTWRSQVKRKHGIITQGGQSIPLPERVEPIEVPSEIEADIEAPLRHFHML